MNDQKPTKQDLARNGTNKPFLVNEIFYTLQGEGPFSGVPAVFIRMGGCNLQCTWCDTEYSDNVEMLESDILSAVEMNSALPLQDLLVVISGGEPFAQDISQLCISLIAMGCTVQIETNGTLTLAEFPWEIAIIVVSPKTKFVHPDIYNNAEYWKYVVSSDDSESEYGTPLFSTQHSKNAGSPAYVPPRVYCKNVFLSPLDSKNASQNFENRKTTVELCMKFGYTLSLQTHKLLNLP